jgi:hypothetical protein
MEIFKKNIKIGLTHIIFTILIISLILLLFLFFTGNEPQDKYLQLIGGLSAGFIVFLVQFLLDWKGFREIEKYKALGIKRILSYRDDEAFYRNFIKSGNRRIWVMGVTALRFMQDFADESRKRPEKRVLIDSLEKGIEVKILMPKVSYLTTHNQKNFHTSNDFFKLVAKKYSGFEYKYFDHIPAHSIFIVDDKCLLGPVFPNTESKDSPCIQTNTHSDFSKKYIDYFQSEWEKANDGS